MSTSYQMHAWEGCSYERPSIWKGRTAIIGESTYRGGLPSDYQFNTEAHARGKAYNFDLKDFVDGSLDYWGRVYHTCQPHQSVTARQFWDESLSFNYVDRWFADQKVRPTRQDLVDSEEPFRSFLATYKPEYLIIVSAATTNHLLRRKILTLEGSIRHTKYGLIDNGNDQVRVCSLHHVRARRGTGVPTLQNELLRSMPNCPFASIGYSPLRGAG